jgi:putative alpha-1,2-mannosidase
MRTAARAMWNGELQTVDGYGGAGDPATLYTALYHAFLQPNVFSDADGRYRGLDHRIHRVRGRFQYTDLALWDSEKTANQLLALLDPRRYRDVLLSLLADYRQRGKLPRWVEKDTDPAYMEGDPALPAIADGVCRGLVSRGDAEALYRAGLKQRRRRGPPPRASTTLEYGVDDFALALVADRLGHRRDARRLASASLAYRSLLDPASHWVRGDLSSFLEGTTFQYTWLAPHDARGLFGRMGGPGVAVQRLDSLFASPVAGDNPNAPPGHRYDSRSYAVGNEQDLQVPWMYAFARASSHGGEALARLRGWFSAAPDGIPGNDDLGALSSWYVFAAIGFGPVTPGAPFYVPSGPAFATVYLHPKGGSTIALTGMPSSRSWITAAALRRGDLVKAGPAPGSASPPPSLSDSPLSRFGCRAR